VGARALIAGSFALAACQGPRPDVTSSSVAPSPDPGFQRVTIHLRNAGGPGEVQLEISLRGCCGRVVRTSTTREVEAHASSLVVVDVAAPPDSYSVTVGADYPD
jgi:hypothetical protein